MIRTKLRTETKKSTAWEPRKLSDLLFIFSWICYWRNLKILLSCWGKFPSNTNYNKVLSALREPSITWNILATRKWRKIMLISWRIDVDVIYASVLVRIFLLALLIYSSVRRIYFCGELPIRPTRLFKLYEKKF